METSSAVQAVKGLRSELTSLGNARLGPLNTAGVTGAFDSIKAQAAGIGDTIRNAISGTGQHWQNLSGWIDKNEQHIKTMGQNLTGFGAIATGVFGAGVWNAANVEQAFSIMAAGTGAAGEELEKLQQLALRLGKDTSFSATEAAAAITELGKAGMSAETIMNGAADAVVNLAVAGEMDLASSANVLTAAMNQFGLSAEDATMVVDTFARGAAVSTADLSDLASGLTYVGTTANMLGFDITDTTAALSALNDQGIRGSMAGTSLNQMLTSLINPSQKAKGAMDELGLSIGQTNSIINDDGTMKTLPEIIKNVDTATRGLTETERARYLNMIFGEQGGRAINALLQTQTEEARAAGKSWEDYAEGVTTGQTAADVAAAKMDNLKGDIEQLMGGLETLAYTATSAFLPAIRWVVQGLDMIVSAMTALPGPVQAAVAGLVGLTGALSLGAGGFLLMLPRINDTVKAFNEFKKAAAVQKVIGSLSGSLGTLRTTLTGFATGGGGGVRGLTTGLMGLARAHPVLAGVTAAVGLFGLAYKTNFLGVGDAVDGVVGSVKSLAADMKAAFGASGESAQIAAEDVAAFAEATHVVDGVTVYTAFTTNADGTRREVGEVIKSVANADGKTAQVLIKAEDGEYWATIDLATGEIFDAQIDVDANTLPLDQRINAALEVVKGRFDAAGIGWGVSLISGLQSGVTKIAAIMSPIMDVVDRVAFRFTNLRASMNPISALLVSISQTMATMNFGPLQGVADSLRGVLSNLGYGFQRIGEAARETVSMIAALWQGNFSDAMAHARNALDLFGQGWGMIADGVQGIGGVVQGVTTFIGQQLQDLAARFPVLGDGLNAVSRMFRQAGEVWSGVFDVVTKLMRGNVSGALKGIGDLAKDVGKLFLDSFEAAGEVIGDLGDLVQRGIGWAFDQLRSRFSGFTTTFNRLQGILGNAVGVVKNLAEAVASLMRGDLSGFFKNIGEAVLDAIQGIANLATLIPSFLFDAFRAIDWGGIGQSIQDGARRALEMLQDLSDAAFDWLADAARAIDFGAIGSAIMEGIQGALAGMRAAMSWALDVGVPAIAGWIVDVAGDIWGGLKAAAGWVSDKVTGLIDLAINVLSALGEVAADLLGSAVDWVVGHIPWLARPLAAAGETISGFIDLVMNLGGSLLSTLGAAWTSLKGLISSFAGWLADFFGIGEDGSASGKTTSASGGFSFLMNLGGSLLSALGAAWTSLKSLISTAWGWIVDFFGIAEDGSASGKTTVASASMSFLMKLLGSITDSMGAAWSSVTSVIGSVGSWLVDFFGISDSGDVSGLVTRSAAASFTFTIQFLSKIANGLGEAWTSLKGVIGTVGGWIADFFGIGVDGSIGSAVSKIASATLTFATEFASDITDSLGSAWDSITSLVGSVSSVAKDLVSAGWNGVTKTVSSTVDFVVTVTGEVKDMLGAGWDFLFGGGDEGGGGGGATTIEGKLQEVADAISTGLENIATALTTWDPQAAIQTMNTNLVNAIGTMDGTSVGTAVKDWIVRAGGKVAGLITPGELMAIPRGVDTALNSAFTGSMSGESLAAGMVAWITRAVPQVATQVQPLGLALARGLDTALTTGLGQMSGANLASQIGLWFTKAVPQVTANLSAQGLALARGLDSALQSGIGALSGGNLATNIVSWIDRAQATAASTVNMTVLATGIATDLQTAITPRLQQIVTGFRTFANDIRRETQTMGRDVATNARTMANDLRSATNQAQGDVSGNFRTMTSNVRSSISDMVSAARTGASDVRSALSNGMRDATSAVRREAGQWAGIISGYAGSMRSAGFSVGAAASEGVASGLRSSLGSIRAAAAEIVAEVDRAMRKAGEIRSPSRVTTRTAMELGAGVVRGLLAMLRDVSRAAGKVATAAMPDLGTVGSRTFEPAINRAHALFNGSVGGGTVTVINNSWSITQQPGESGEAFAERALDLMLAGYMDGGML